jgi:hypothetical protein
VAEFEPVTKQELKRRLAGAMLLASISLKIEEDGTMFNVVVNPNATRALFENAPKTNTDKMRFLEDMLCDIFGEALAKTISMIYEEARRKAN